MDSPIPETEAQPIVHCGNLSAETTSVELISLFSSAAPVLKISLRKKGDTKTAFAFVTFSSIKDAEQIIDKFNYYSLHSRQMILTIYNKEQSYPPNSNIFVKNLPDKLNSKDLYEIFKMFGPVVSCKVATNENGESKGFGFVQYKNAKSAKKSIQTCQNAKIGNNALEVMLYDKHLKGAKVEAEQSVPVFTNVYIKNFPLSISEERLKGILERYGEVNSIFMPLSSKGVPVGYACANFVRPEDASKAIEGLHEQFKFDPEEYEDDEVLVIPPFYIQKAEKKKEREEQLRKLLDSLSLDGNHAKRNLYVSNIPDSFSKEEIKNIFSKFGTVTNIKIEKSSPSSNFQYGYICFSTPEEAAAAYENVGGICLDENKLQVSYYKNKIERLSEDEPVKMCSMSSNSGDRFHNSSCSKLVRAIENIIAKSSARYRSYLSEFNAKTMEEFAQIVSKEFSSLPENELKEMVSSPTLLDSKIKRFVSSKKEKIRSTATNQ